MDSAQLIATVLGAGGGGAVLVAVVNGLMKWLSGASGRERERNTTLDAQRVKAIEARDRAIQERDEEAAKRRIIQEALSASRRLLIENGIQPGEWPMEATQPNRRTRTIPKRKEKE